jgi:Holliday junction resolvase RusA-like endonuclease
MKICFTSIGEPFGKERPRFVTKYSEGKRGYKGGFAYTPKKTKEHERKIAMDYATHPNHIDFRRVPVKIKIHAYYKIPKKFNLAQRAAASEQKLLPKHKKPDVDNIAKLIMDALEGYAYINDVQICEMEIKKFYGIPPRVEIEIEEIEERKNESV